MTAPSASRHESSTTGARWASAAVVALVVGAAQGGCATDPAPARAPAAPPALPPALGVALPTDPVLDEAAALLCARDTDNVIDGDVRAATGLVDGQVAALLERAASADAATAALAARAAALVDETRATHAGFAAGLTPEGAPCAALVVARRLVVVETRLVARPDALAPFPFAAQGAFTSATLYLLRPTGLVDQRALVPEGGRVSDIVVPGPIEGRHVLELVVVGDDDDPEVALLWPFVVGNPKIYPIPEVLFPDEGHDDIALTHRLEALVLRLRNEQELDVLMLSPALSDVARARASALDDQGSLGHRRPGGRSIGDDLVARGDTAFSRFAEVQAQASTLKEAWGALVGSPGHRFALLDQGMTHVGGSVVKGTDGLGRPLVSVVVVVGRRLSARATTELKTELLGRLNLARHARGLPVLTRDPALDAIADSHARAMASVGVVEESVDGGPPVAALAVETTGYAEVRAVLAALDDPLRLAPSRATLAPGSDVVGIGLAPGGPGARIMVCLLVATTEGSR